MNLEVRDCLTPVLGIERKFLAEVHGDFFVDECNLCLSRFIRRTASPTMAQKVSTTPCPRKERPCRGFLRDTILDWEDQLPESELTSSEKHVDKADLVICLGSLPLLLPLSLTHSRFQVRLYKSTQSANCLSKAYEGKGPCPAALSS